MSASAATVSRAPGVPRVKPTWWQRQWTIPWTVYRLTSMFTSFETRRDAIRQLAQFDCAKAHGALVRIATNDRDYEPALRFEALKALAARHDARAFAPLVQLLSVAYCQELAADILAELGDPRAIEPIAALLTAPRRTGQPQPDPVPVALALARLGDRRGLPWLAVAALVDQSVKAGAALSSWTCAEGRERAWVAVGVCDWPGAVAEGDAAIEALDRVLQSTGAATHETPGQRREHLLGVKREAIRALAEIGGERAIPPLVRFLDDPSNQDDAEEAQAVLTKLGAVEQLGELLRNGTPTGRWNALTILNKSGDPRAVRHLASACEQPDLSMWIAQALQARLRSSIGDITSDDLCSVAQLPDRVEHVRTERVLVNERTDQWTDQDVHDWVDLTPLKKLAQDELDRRRANEPAL